MPSLTTRSASQANLPPHQAAVLTAKQTTAPAAAATTGGNVDDAEESRCRTTRSTNEANDDSVKGNNEGGAENLNPGIHRTHPPTMNTRDLIGNDPSAAANLPPTTNQRMAEARDELFFKQPESSCWGDCPICYLPLPLDPQKSVMTTCCSKTICDGCHNANQIRQLGLLKPQWPSCAFCREPLPKTDEEFDAMLMKRVEKNDPVAMRQMGCTRHNEGDYKSAFEYFTKAAELGDAWAHYNLSVMYRLGQGVEKDEKKLFYHLEEAVIGGSVIARHDLGCHERMERAVKHFIIAASMGHEGSMKALWKCYAMGFLKKDDLTATLRAHHAAVGATKSPQRDEAEKFLKRRSQ